LNTRKFVFKASAMAKMRPSDRPEFRRQIVNLIRAGRSPEELAQVCDGAVDEELGRLGGV
jgi:hypothetical protein